MAECNRRKGPSLVGGRKVVKMDWSDTFGELLVYCSGLDCVCMYYSSLAIVVSYFRVLYMFNLVARLQAPASLEGGIIKGISGYKAAHSITHSSFIHLFVRLYSLFTSSSVLVQNEFFESTRSNKT